jgi:hypothetical protein
MWISLAIPLKRNDAAVKIDVEASVEKAPIPILNLCKVVKFLAIQKGSHLTPRYELWKKVYNSFQISN